MYGSRLGSLVEPMATSQRERVGAHPSPVLPALSNGMRQGSVCRYCAHVLGLNGGRV